MTALKRAFAGLISLAFTLTGPANAERVANTPSGVPEGIFTAATAESIRSEILNFCMDRGFPTTSDMTSVTCELPMSALGSAVLGALIAPKYSSPLRSNIQFTVNQSGQDVRVQARGWLETQTAFGQVQRTPSTDDDFFNGAVAILQSLGAEYPLGTSFPYKPYLGLDEYEYVKLEGDTPTVLVKALKKGSPLDVAGVQVGDFIETINGTTLKNEKTFNSALGKLNIGEVYDIKFWRKIVLKYGVDGFIGDQSKYYDTHTVRFKAQARKPIFKLGETIHYETP